MTQIMDHGKWQLYQPDRLPEDAPPTALFARREEDGVDWYIYSRNPEHFTAGTVKFTARWRDDHNGYVIGAAAYEADRLFPAGQRVLEIINYHGDNDPQRELGDRLYDPDTRTLLGRPAPPPPVFDFAALLDRLAVIEARLGITP